MTLGIFQGHWTVSHQISQKRCVIRQKLLQTTNRKSYTSFRLVPLLMTLKYIWRSFQPRLSFLRQFQLSLACFRVARSPSNSWASCYRATLCVACTVFGIVILSVCPSVTLVDCVHMVRPTIMIYSPYGSPIILLSEYITFIPKFEGGHAERGRWMKVEWILIGDFRPVSRRISETVRDTTKVTISH